MPESTAQTLSLKWLFFSFKGRIARQSYILSIIFIQVLFGLVVYRIIRAGEDENQLALWGLVFIALAAISFWCGLALSIKRIHDLGLPWPLVILQFIPPIMWFFILFLMVMPSKQETNEHGPPPFPD